MPPVTRRGPYIHSVSLLRDRIDRPDDFPFALPAIRHLSTLELHPKVTFFVGENGSGKSTLLEAIAGGCELNPEGGSRHFDFATRETHSTLDRYLRLARNAIVPNDSYFLRAETFYNVATEVDRLGMAVSAYGGKSLHAQSHGEAFMALFEHRFKGTGLYLLDEPEAALSPRRQMEFLSLLHQYCEQGAQFIIATHAPIIMAYPHAWIYVFGANGLERTAYEQTEHYDLTRTFLLKREKMLRILMGDEEA